jgi:hypothetical protein
MNNTVLHIMVSYISGIKLQIPNRKTTEVTVCSKEPENVDIKMDDNALKQAPKLKYLGRIFTEHGKNTEDIIQRIKGAKLGMTDQHYALIIPLFITQAPTCFSTYVPSSGSIL